MSFARFNLFWTSFIKDGLPTHFDKRITPFAKYIYKYLGRYKHSSWLYTNHSKYVYAYTHDLCPGKCTSSGHKERTTITSLIAKFMGLTWDPPGADRTQVGPMVAPWILLSGIYDYFVRSINQKRPLPSHFFVEFVNNLLYQQAISDISSYIYWCERYHVNHMLGPVFPPFTVFAPLYSRWHILHSSSFHRKVY